MQVFLAARYSCIVCIHVVKNKFSADYIMSKVGWLPKGNLGLLKDLFSVLSISILSYWLPAFKQHIFVIHFGRESSPSG